MAISDDDRLFILRYVTRSRAAKYGKTADDADAAWAQGLQLVSNTVLETVREFLRALPDDQIDDIGSGDATQTADGWTMVNGASYISISDEYYGFLSYIDSLMIPAATGG